MTGNKDNGRDNYLAGRGQPLPFGATVKKDGVNFAVFSKHATSVSLVLFDPDKKEMVREFSLDPHLNKTGDNWHIFVKGLTPGMEYCYKMDRDPNDEKLIHRFSPDKLLLDPYATAISGSEKWGIILKNGEQIPDGSFVSPRRCVISEDEFDWENDTTLNLPLSESIIYELHVRGFTRHGSSGVKAPGTYAGLIEKIPYLKELGVTAVELLPINEFEENDTDRINPDTGERLLNFWGYHSIAFFAPKTSYSSGKDAVSAVREFKTMVKAMHDAGVEVILDVVFNHTAEGDERGHTFSFKGIDNSVYYLVDPLSGSYFNYSGCGNTVNCNHPVVRDMILDCLRYWVMEMHIDGFRFDLASILGRGQDGSVLSNPPLLERIAGDPVLSKSKLIAEAWDAAGLYQVGSFPHWGRWAEWNGMFRDDVRKFLRGEPGMVSLLASRIMGSPDVYQGSGRAPYHSINFVTCHDGFTLMDLVSFDKKHNHENGEDSKDGSDDNISWNCGWDGPIEDPDDISDIKISANEVNETRQRQLRNFACLLLLSRGVPMLLAGDETGRTQGGNNNAYCHDNDITWLNWDLKDKNADLFRFFKQLIDFRKAHPSLRHGSFVGKDEAPEFFVNWHGVEADKPDWSHESRSFAVQISEKLCDVPLRVNEIYIAANSFWDDLFFELPKLKDGRKWCLAIDTSKKSPEDIRAAGKEETLSDQKSYAVKSRSVIVLIGK